MKSRPLRDMVLAFSLLTIVPTRAEIAHGERTGTAAWFPAVGLSLGAVVWSVAHLMRLAGWQTSGGYFVAAFLVAVLAASTRMLHWDGLGDAADAVWGGYTPERRLEIMADTSIGSFGASAIALAAAAQIAAVGSVLYGMHELPLLVVPALARLAATCAAWLGKPARDGGLGRSVMGGPRLHEIVIAAAVVGSCIWVLVVAYGVPGAVFGVVAVVLALVVPHVVSMPMGGVTGDVMGASVVICETVLFGIAAVLWGA